MKDGTNLALRERIIKESVTLFLQQGYHGTTVKSITDASGASKGSFYWYFKSKKELLETIIDEFENSFVENLIKTVGQTDAEFGEKVWQTHKYMTDFAYANRDLCVGFLTLAAEFAGNGSEIEARIKAVYKKFVDYFQTLINQGKAERKVKPELGTMVLARVLFAINNGVLLEWYMNAAEMNSRLLSRTSFEVMLHGISTNSV
jgi:AcrR family transcriptional regulator